MKDWNWKAMVELRQIRHSESLSYLRSWELPCSCLRVLVAVLARSRPSSVWRSGGSWQCCWQGVAFCLPQRGG